MVPLRFSHKAEFVWALAIVILLTGCRQNSDSRQEESCLEFLYEYMPVTDDLLHTREFWENNVRKTLEVQKRMGWDIPEEIFKYFVLPLRSGNEDVDDFRTTYADTLCRRIEGMNMAQAAVEVNYWCLEQAGFGSSDAKSPMGTVASGLGECNQLSELLVSALRAAGIPARKINAVWAHKNGAHSWVEAWSDGGWHYMGGCEPAPGFDFAWIYKDATCIMQTSTTVYGDYTGPETIISKNNRNTVISNLRRYAPVKNSTVTVLDPEGNTVAEAAVAFLVGKNQRLVFYNTLSDSEGKVRLETGFGDCAVVANKGELWGVTKLLSRDTTAILTLDTGHEEAAGAAQTMTLIPPVAGIVPGTPEGYEEWLGGTAREKMTDSIRVANRAKIAKEKCSTNETF